MAKPTNQDPYAPQPPPQSNVYRSSSMPIPGGGYGGHGQGTVAGQSYTLAGTKSDDPYRSGLTSDVTGKWDVPKGQTFNDYSNDSDADVRELQRITNETSAARAGLDKGVSFAANQAQIDALKARIAQKNALGQSISGSDAAEGAAENDLRYNAADALGRGVKNTRENYNGRGLLYSGLRQGGESAVRSGVASTMASGLANTKRDYANSKDQAKAAYAAVDQAQAAVKLQAANQAFDTVSKNNVARQQAYQQLGEGLGRAAGTMYSSYGAKPGAATTPGASGFEGGFAGTGSKDGYGGSQLSASNDDSYWRTA